MRWLSIRKQDGSIDDRAIQSECKTFTICKVTVWGQVWFEAWTGRKFLFRDQNVDALKGKVDAHAQPAAPAA